MEAIMAKKISIPAEFICELAIGGWATTLKGFMYVVREKFDATTALELIERYFKRDDRIKNLTKFIKDVFRIEGNDAEAWAQWWDIWCEIFGIETTWLERSTTVARNKNSKCPWKTGYKDISDWCEIWTNIVYTTINPKATLERPKAMCAGDPYCEYVFKLEELI